MNAHVPTSVLAVFIAALITALATGLGALPFAFWKAVGTSAVAYANALASGLMLGASFGLVAEGSGVNGPATMGGAALGVLAIIGADRALRGVEARPGRERASGTRRMLLVMTVMTAHSFAEGVAVGVAFGGGARLAVAITLAIAIHNIPEGLAISATFRPRGASIAACALWSIVSSLPQPVMAVPAFLFVETFRGVLPWGLGFAAGAMVFMVLVELLPEAYEQARAPKVALLVSLTLVGMALAQRSL